MVQSSELPGRRLQPIVSATLALLMLATAVIPAHASLVRTSDPTLDWTECTKTSHKGFQCATATVPLDYARPTAGTIQLSVARHLAENSAARLGTLFINPGGPGAAGADLLPKMYPAFPEAVRQRFDLISWDPRGVGNSTAVKCFASGKELAAFFANVSVPLSEHEEQVWIRTYAEFTRRCKERNPELLEHVSTADSAQDLDFLRAAVGEEKLNYYGASYGTFLGATYVNMFPSRANRVILDSNVLPTAWTNNGNPEAGLTSTSLRIGAPRGAQATLEQFLKLCGKSPNCAFSAGSPDHTQQKFHALLERLRAGPIPLNGTQMTYVQVVSLIPRILNAVHPVAGTQGGWPSLAGMLEELWKASSTYGKVQSSPRQQQQQQQQHPLRKRHLYFGPEQLFAVECGESPNPRKPEAFVAIGQLASAAFGPLAPFFTWGEEPCASWLARASNYYSGPWDRMTKQTVLVVGATYDPATPFENSVGMAKLLANARLLTVEGYGHCTLFNPSTCVNDYLAKYLITGDLPPEGSVCQQDAPPFSSAVSPSSLFSSGDWFTGHPFLD